MDVSQLGPLLEAESIRTTTIQIDGFVASSEQAVKASSDMASAFGKAGGTSKEMSQSVAGMALSVKSVTQEYQKFSKPADDAAKASEKLGEATGKIRGSMVDFAKDLLSGEEPMKAFAKNGLDIASTAAEAGMGIEDVAGAMGLMNPVGAGIAVVGAAGVAAFMGLKDAADKAADNKDFINSLGLSKDQMAQLKDTSVTTGDVFGGLGKAAEDLWNSINKGDIVGKTIGNMLSAMTTTAGTVLKTISDVIVDIIAYAVGGESAYISAWRHAPEALGDLAISAANNVLKGLEDIVNASLHAVGSLMDKLGIKNDFGKMEIKFGEINNPFKGKAASWGSDVVKDFNAGVNGTKSMFKGLGDMAVAGVKAVGKAVGDATATVVDDIVQVSHERISSDANAIRQAGQDAADAQKAACQCQGAGGNAAQDASNSGATGHTASRHAKKTAQSGKSGFTADQYKIREPKLELGFIEHYVRDLDTTLPKVPDVIKPWSKEINAAKEAFTVFAQSAVDSLKKVIKSGGDLGKTISSAFKDIAKNYLNSQIEKIFNSLGKVLSKSSNPVMSFIGGLFTKKNAMGGVYDSPSLSAYSGGVYDSPRMFAFANGAGVFAEAGPEAIMPLTRGSDGKLGVRASGGGSEPTHIRVYVDQDGNWQAAVQQIAAGVAAPIAQQAGVSAAQGGSAMAITRQNKTQRNRLA